MDELNELKASLEALTDAHRAVAARGEAMIMCCRIMYPFITIAPQLKARLIDCATLALNDHMQKSDFDDDFQAQATRAMHEIFSTLATGY